MTEVISISLSDDAAVAVKNLKAKQINISELISVLVVKHYSRSLKTPEAKEESKETKLDKQIINKAINSYKEGNKDLMTWFVDQGMPKNIAKVYTSATMDQIWRESI